MAQTDIATGCARGAGIWALSGAQGVGVQVIGTGTA
jgi:hypothetical protein